MLLRPFAVKIYPASPLPSPPQGGEGTIFMGGGDQEPVMMVYETIKHWMRTCQPLMAMQPGTVNGEPLKPG